MVGCRLFRRAWAVYWLRVRRVGPRYDARILLPNLLRRVAVLTVISAVGISLLAPLTALSAMPELVEAHRLLDAADQPGTALARGTLEGRDRSASLNLASAPQGLAPETLAAPVALPTPASAPMEATLYSIRVAPPPPAHLSAVSEASEPAPTSEPPAASEPPPPPPPPPTPSQSISGTATWYCCTLGYRGQAVVALPGPLGGQYNPPPASRVVTVCADRCVQLPVVDYCECHWGTAEQRVADLSPEAWAAVSDAPLSRGVITVSVTLGG